MNEPITTERYDIGRGEILRIARLHTLNRLLPLGYFAGFTRVRQLAVLFVVHRFGRWLFRLIIPHEARLTRLYRMLGRK